MPLPNTYQPSTSRSFFHSKPVLFFMALLVLSTLFFGGSLVSVSKMELHASAPAPAVDARIKLMLSANVFQDVKADNPHAYAIVYLKSLGLVEGYSDNRFQPEKTLERGEFMVFIAKARRVYPYAVRYNYCFDDVKNEWFAPATCFAKSKGWVSEDDTNMFHPEQIVTKAVGLKIVASSFGVTLLSAPPEGVAVPAMAADAWYAPYVWTAAAKNWLGDDPSSFMPDGELTRGELAGLLYKVMISELPPV